jgi:epoxyqueuosine reductase
MRAAIKARALELGFDHCRITSAAPPASAGVLGKWLAEGKHGQMGWLERNSAKRADPSLVLPGVKSIVLVAASYYAGISRAAEIQRKNTGVIARYARHLDYHDIMAVALKDLAAFIAGRGGDGCRSLWYVDTGPVLERDLGQRSGLGFIGKHTNLVSRSLGNWFLIGEILTTLELEPDERQSQIARFLGPTDRPSHRPDRGRRPCRTPANWPGAKLSPRRHLRRRVRGLHPLLLLDLRPRR